MIARNPTFDLGVQMPSGVLACSCRLLAPSPVIALLARLRARCLDERLAAGADPLTSPLLAARAAQLAAPRSRSRIAAGLERMALSLDAPRSLFAIEPERGAVAPNRDSLLALALTLRSGRPVYAGGIAEARLIVTDGTGPAYTDRRGEGLARQLALAQARLAS
jgi:hypothetical protein